MVSIYTQEVKWLLFVVKIIWLLKVGYFQWGVHPISIVQWLKSSDNVILVIVSIEFSDGPFANTCEE